MKNSIKGKNTGMYPQILDAKRQQLLPRLAFLKDYGFYLAGGTALAFQIGHRTSADFDFYTPDAFEPMALWERIAKEFPVSENRRMADGTLIAVIEKEIEVSFFRYEYPLLKPAVVFHPFRLASLEDIAAMKVIAIVQRGIQRDFIDLYFLARELGLYEVISATLKKYKGYNVYPIFQALCYFEDAEEGSQGRYRMLAPVDWDEVKKFFLREVRRVEKFY